MGRAKYRWSISRISPHPEKIGLLLGIPIKMKRCCSELITKRLFWGPTWPTPPETEDYFCQNRAFCAKFLFGTEKIMFLLWKPTVCWIPDPSTWEFVFAQIKMCLLSDRGRVFLAAWPWILLIAVFPRDFKQNYIFCQVSEFFQHAWFRAKTTVRVSLVNTSFSDYNLVVFM